MESRTRRCDSGGVLQKAHKKGRKFLNPEPTSVGGLKMMFRVLPLYLRNKEERSPRVKVGPFVTDATRYAEPPAGGLRVTWFGHSALLVEIDGVRVLLDPMWDQRASPFRFLGPKRFFPPTLEASDLPEIDVVILSHDHYDHLGRRTVQKLARLPKTAKALWVTSLGVGPLLRRWGVTPERVRELDWTESVTVDGADGHLEITSVPTRHFSGRSLRNRFETLWAAFVLRGRQHSLYFGADTGLWQGMADIAKTYGPFDLTLLEIGAYNELWADIHLGPDGATKAFEQMGASGMLMPIHWGLFDLALHGWRQPIERMTELARAKGWTLFSPEPGVPTEVVAGKQVVSDWWRKQR